MSRDDRIAPRDDRDVMAGHATLAFDLGGTKLAAALVDGNRIIDRIKRATRRDAGPEGWVSDMVQIAQTWHDRFDSIGLALTGQVLDGRWAALNRTTLDIADSYPIIQTLEVRIGVPVHAWNDAQAAAWGEYRCGAGRGRDLVFMTVSTGVGGGVVLAGRLVMGRSGLAGHIGQIPFGRITAEQAGVADDIPMPIDSEVGGHWIAAAAQCAGHAVTAPQVFAAARNGEDWAETIVEFSARRTARLCETLQAVLDPELIIIGGGVGLADGYLDRVRRALAPKNAALQPTLIRAELGADAGLLGVADLTRWSIMQSQPEECP